LNDRVDLTEKAERAEQIDCAEEEDSSSTCRLLDCFGVCVLETTSSSVAIAVACETVTGGSSSFVGVGEEGVEGVGAAGVGVNFKFEMSGVTLKYGVGTWASVPSEVFEAENEGVVSGTIPVVLVSEIVASDASLWGESEGERVEDDVGGGDGEEEGLGEEEEDLEEEAEEEGLLIERSLTGSLPLLALLSLAENLLHW
jgi:hypothetical protein